VSEATRAAQLELELKLERAERQVEQHREAAEMVSEKSQSEQSVVVRDVQTNALRDRGPTSPCRKGGWGGGQCSLLGLWIWTGLASSVWLQLQQPGRGMLKSQRSLYLCPVSGPS